MYSWLVPGVEVFEKMKAADRIPHAVLLTVAPGLGGGQLAKAIARRFLCHEQALEGCNCHSCVCLEAGTHPDYHAIVRDENSTSLGIEQVRQGMRELDGTAAANHGKVLYIEEAEYMTIPAANALLKTLEEPPANSLIILTTGSLQSLLPTIVSRCMRITVPQPSAIVLNDFLRQELNTTDDYSMELSVLGMSPLRVIDCVRNEDHLKLREAVEQVADCICGRNQPLTTAGFFDKKLTAPDLVYGLLYGIIREAMAYQAGVDKETISILRKRPDALEILAQISPVSLSQALNRILALRQVPSIKTSYVNQLQLLNWFTLLSNVKVTK